MSQHKNPLATAMVIAGLVLAGCGGPAPREAVITDLVPTEDEAEGWTPLAEAQVFEGEALFELINGGAEIYHEFGFRQALSQDFTGPGQHVVALEIFEMEDTAAACGTYAFKISGDGRAMDLGDEAMLEDYYLNFRRGRYVVTVTGMNDDEATVEGITRVASAVAGKIHTDGAVPKIVIDLTTGDPEPERVFYLRGELALANVAPFAAGLRLGMREGAAARFDGRTKVVLRFADSAQALQQYAAVVDELGHRTGWMIIENGATDAALRHHGNGSRLELAAADDTIVMVVSDG